MRTISNKSGQNLLPVREQRTIKTKTMIAVIITLIIVIPLSIAWANGIDKNKDYKGEDFLNNN